MTTTTDDGLPPDQRDDRFFLGTVIAMAVVLVAGFSVQLATGRSSFSAPLMVHAHAVVFMGWLGIYLLQNIFVATGRSALHRRLGWIGAGWILAMLVLGCAVTVDMARRGAIPFFFRPLQFLVFDVLSLLTFVGLTTAAIALRRQTDWHRRLHFCAMAILLGPGLGRLLPMPLLTPWAWEATFVVSLIFPLVGMWADHRRSGRIHPAWSRGLAAMFGLLLVVEAVTYSPLGDALYRAAVAGSPGAAVAPLAFPPPPGPPPMGEVGAR
ncbi:hypothetical protein [Phenylobacterium sp.]|jgi:hypothetical protein|uniref:hypothetical protein n=1 Tax=Phenylobacterium sp. TaxID=1871053 RepID=UPI0037CB5606